MQLIGILSLLALVTALPLDITPLSPFPVPNPVPTCALNSLVCNAAADCGKDGICVFFPGTTTGCCQKSGGVPLPSDVSLPPPSDSVCPISVPLCISDADCGITGYCNHTTSSSSNIFGCCEFGGPAPSIAPMPSDLITPPPLPGVQICPAYITECVMDTDCVSGDYCDHLSSNSDVFGCCHAGSAPTTAPMIPTAPPGILTCPPYITPCVTDSDCVSGDYCDHHETHSEYFGCCHAGSAPSDLPLPMPDLSTPMPTLHPAQVPCDIDSLACSDDLECRAAGFGFCSRAPLDTTGCCIPIATQPFPAPPTPEQPRCVAELQCLVDTDCGQFDGSCDYVEGNPLGCCRPHSF